MKKKKTLAILGTGNIGRAMALGLTGRGSFLHLGELLPVCPQSPTQFGICSSAFAIGLAPSPIGTRIASISLA